MYLIGHLYNSPGREKIEREREEERIFQAKN
jgi:hypothetical protein